MCIQLQARKMCEHVTVGCGFTSDCLRKWHEVNFNQSQSTVKQKQSKCGLILTLNDRFIVTAVF